MPTPWSDIIPLSEILELIARLTRQEFLLLQADGTIKHATANTADVLRCPEEGLTGINLADLLGPEASRKLLSLVKQNDELVTEELKLTCSGGKPSHFQIALISCTANTPPTQEESLLLALSPLDLTPDKEKLRAMEELAASLAHEIRNPLAGILTTAETMYEDLAPQDARREYLERIMAEIKRVNRFLVKFLVLARPQRPQFSLASFPELLDNILHLENKEIERQRIRVVRNYAPGLPKILIDPQQMQQVLLNLVLNAIQAMPQGGILRLDIRCDENPGEQSYLMQVEISDTGTGINPQDLEKIFLPFFTTKPKGVGLGLSVSQHIMEQHQGQIKARSTAGKGTAFTLILPLKQNNQKIKGIQEA